MTKHHQTTQNHKQQKRLDIRAREARSFFSHLDATGLDTLAGIATPERRIWGSFSSNQLPPTGCQAQRPAVGQGGVA